MATISDARSAGTGDGQPSQRLMRVDAAMSASNRAQASSITTCAEKEAETVPAPGEYLHVAMGGFQAVTIHIVLARSSGLSSSAIPSASPRPWLGSPGQRPGAIEDVPPHEDGRFGADGGAIASPADGHHGALCLPSWRTRSLRHVSRRSEMTTRPLRAEVRQNRPEQVVVSAAAGRSMRSAMALAPNPIQMGGRSGHPWQSTT